MMAGVEHAYQYSVEVKSRFSLFLDDSLNNEDPDILISKLQHERCKKEKLAKPEQKPNDVADIKPNVELAKESKPVKPPTPLEQESEPNPPDHIAPHPPTFRGRGEGHPRGFRGRGRGGYGYHENAADQAGDSQNQSGYPHDNRGRGRARGRFFRGRGYAFDHREYPNQGYDRNQARSAVHGDDSAHENRETTEAEAAATEYKESPDQVNDTGAEPAGKAADEADVEEQKTYTLEEYKAMRSSSKPVVVLATKGTRKANDGKDVFKNMVAHRKVTEVAGDKECEVEYVEKAPPPEDNKYEINVTFTDRMVVRDRPGRGFGGRGFSRGRGQPGLRGGRPRAPRANFRGERGRGYGRGAHPEDHTAPVVLNDQDFPSLK